MAKDKLDYIRNVEVEYDASADIARGPVTPLTAYDQYAVDNLGAYKILFEQKNRVGFCIQAKSTNTGKIYLGCDLSVSSTRWFAELQAGMACTSNEYCGEIWAKADVIDFQHLGYVSW